MNGSVFSVIGETAFYVAVAVLLVLFFFKKKKQLRSMREHQESEKTNQS